MLVKIKLCVVNQDYQTCLALARRNQNLSTNYQRNMLKIYSFGWKSEKNTLEYALGVYISNDCSSCETAVSARFGCSCPDNDQLAYKRWLALLAGYQLNPTDQSCIIIMKFFVSLLSLTTLLTTFSWRLSPVLSLPPPWLRPTLPCSTLGTVTHTPTGSMPSLASPPHVSMLPTSPSPVLELPSPMPATPTWVSLNMEN